MAPTLYAKAREAGEKLYFTGKPCRRGHIEPRSVKTGVCRGCAKVYAKQTRAGAWHKAYESAYRTKNGEHLAERADQWRKKNRAHLTAEVRRWRAANPKKAKSHRVKYESANKAKRTLARKCRNAAEGSHTLGDLYTLWMKQSGRCPGCLDDLSPDWHADHIMPLKLGGTSWISNIQLLCPGCNLSKGAKHPIVWAQQNGRLL